MQNPTVDCEIFVLRRILPSLLVLQQLGACLSHQCAAADAVLRWLLQDSSLFEGRRHALGCLPLPLVADDCGMQHRHGSLVNSFEGVESFQNDSAGSLHVGFVERDHVTACRFVEPIRELEGIGVRDLEVCEHLGSAGCPFVLIDGEYRVLIAEHFTRTLHEFGKGPAPEIIAAPSWVLGAVAEQPGAGRVAVQVQVVLELASVLLLQPNSQLVQSADLWVHQLVARIELPV